jgi:hypothetical protein
MNVEVIASLIRLNNDLANPSVYFRITFPTKPSQTTTSATPSGITVSFNTAPPTDKIYNVIIIGKDNSIIYSFMFSLAG